MSSRLALRPPLLASKAFSQSLSSWRIIWDSSGDSDWIVWLKSCMDIFAGRFGMNPLPFFELCLPARSVPRCVPCRVEGH